MTFGAISSSHTLRAVRTGMLCCCRIGERCRPSFRRHQASCLVLAFQLDRVVRRTGAPIQADRRLFSGFEGIDEAPPRIGNASDRSRHPACARRCSIAHQYAAVIAEEGLGVNLAAARLKIEKHGRLVNVVAAPIGRIYDVLVLLCPFPSGPERSSRRHG